MNKTIFPYFNLIVLDHALFVYVWQNWAIKILLSLYICLFLHHKLLAQTEQVNYPKDMGWVNIKTDFGAKVEFYNLIGQMVLSISNPTETIALQNLQKGLFLTKIYVGKDIFIQKIVKL